MAERTMAPTLTVVDDGPMDEPTIDCTICCRPGYLEVQVQTLNNEAEWRVVYRYVICERHLERLQVSWSMLGHDSRVILQRVD